MMRAFRSLITVLATGFILFFFSELVFWARYQPGVNRLSDWLLTWLAYCLLAYAFLLAAAGFRVRSLPALFLCGALYGWLGEGVIVQTMYQIFPLQISWTGLAWHALISVLFGWVLLRLRLMQDRPAGVIGVAFPAGLVWGLWAIFWWVEPGGYKAEVPAFAAFALVTTLLLAVSYWVAFRWGTPVFLPGRWGARVVALLAVVGFIVNVLPYYPVTGFSLPLLAGLTLVSLRRNRQLETRAPLTEQLSARVHLVSYLGLLGLPVGAVLVYGLAWVLNAQIATNWLFLFVTAPAGAVLWVWSVVRLLGSHRSSAVEKPASS